MEIVSIGDFTYHVINEAPNKGDWFIFNNPNPESSLKNRLYQCDKVWNDGSIQPIQ